MINNLTKCIKANEDDLFKKIIVLLLCALLFSSCIVFHTGSISSGPVASVHDEHLGQAQGVSKSVFVVFFANIKDNTLIAEAKKDLYKNAKLKPGMYLSNFTTDINSAYIFFIKRVKVTVGADILYDNSYKVKDYNPSFNAQIDKIIKNSNNFDTAYYSGTRNVSSFEKCIILSVEKGKRLLIPLYKKDSIIENYVDTNVFYASTFGRTYREAFLKINGLRFKLNILGVNQNNEYLLKYGYSKSIIKFKKELEFPINKEEIKPKRNYSLDSLGNLSFKIDSTAYYYNVSQQNYTNCKVHYNVYNEIIRVEQASRKEIEDFSERNIFFQGKSENDLQPDSYIRYRSLPLAKKVLLLGINNFHQVLLLDDGKVYVYPISAVR